MKIIENNFVGLFLIKPVAFFYFFLKLDFYFYHFSSSPSVLGVFFSVAHFSRTQTHAHTYTHNHQSVSNSSLSLFIAGKLLKSVRVHVFEKNYTC